MCVQIATFNNLVIICYQFISNVNSFARTQVTQRLLTLLSSFLSDLAIRMKSHVDHLVPLSIIVDVHGIFTN